MLLRTELTTLISYDHGLADAARAVGLVVEPHGFLVAGWRGEPTNAAPEEHDDLDWFELDDVAAPTLADPSYIALLWPPLC